MKMIVLYPYKKGSQVPLTYLVFLVFTVITIGGCSQSRKTVDLPVCNGSYHKIQVLKDSYYKVYDIRDTAGLVVMHDSVDMLPLANLNNRWDSTFLFARLKNNRIPDMAIDYGETGRISYSFKVSRNGRIKDIETTSSYAGLSLDYFIHELKEISENYRVTDAQYFNKTWYLNIYLRQEDF